METHYDMVVIGGGAAGLSAAAAARRRGASVLLVERSRLGGDCTWTGCVPSKALIERAGQVHAARGLGLQPDVDFAHVMRTVHDAVTEIAGDEARPVLERHGITVAQGSASFLTPRKLDVDGTKIAADRAVIATGTTPTLLPTGDVPAGEQLTNETVFDLSEQPQRLAVAGGGPVGLELAQAFARLGTAVTLLERDGRLAGKEEPEASDVIRSVLEDEGVAVTTGATVVGALPGDRGLTLQVEGRDPVVVDALLTAIGRTPATADLGLEAAGVRLDDKGYVRTDERLRTTADGIYAIGDITGRLPFTHAADEMGRVAVTNALARLPYRRWSSRAVPWATFTDPEIGRVGMTEAQAFEQFGEDAQVAYLPLNVTDRARATGRRAGFVKLVAGPRRLLRNVAGGQLLGATIVSPAGSEVVQEAALAIQTRALTARLAQTVHAYPSWSIAVRQAAAMFLTRTQHGTARPATAAGRGRSS